MNSGSRDSLNVSARCGCSRNAFQIRPTVERLNPEWAAIEARDQCVASRGVDSRVSATTRSTSSSVIVRGAPGRGSSTSPSSRSATNRARHFPTELALQRGLQEPLGQLLQQPALTGQLQPPARARLANRSISCSSTTSSPGCCMSLRAESAVATSVIDAISMIRSYTDLVAVPIRVRLRLRSGAVARRRRGLGQLGATPNRLALGRSATWPGPMFPQVEGLSDTLTQGHWIGGNPVDETLLPISDDLRNELTRLTA
jgi:hypothetical protein